SCLPDVRSCSRLNARKTCLRVRAEVARNAMSNDGKPIVTRYHFRSGLSEQPLWMEKYDEHEIIASSQRAGRRRHNSHLWLRRAACEADKRFGCTARQSGSGSSSDSADK